MFADINIWACLVSAVAVFFLGGIWYSRILFGGLWKKCSSGKDMQCKGGHGALPLILSFVLSFIAVAALSWILGPSPSMNVAVKTGLLISIFWIATSIATNYLFSGRSFAMFLIDAGYHVAQFVIYGVILGLWH